MALMLATLGLTLRLALRRSLPVLAVIGLLGRGRRLGGGGQCEGKRKRGNENLSWKSPERSIERILDRSVRRVGAAAAPTSGGGPAGTWPAQ